MAARTLALAIPSYNRAQILEENLRAMSATLQRLDVAVHVLDDSSNDDTAQAMARVAATTNLRLHYRRNTPALRHDANLLACLAAPGTDFVWLLGDASVVDDVSLQAVHARLADQDFVFVNSRGGEAPATREHIADVELRPFMAQRAWDLSYTGATIYHRRVIDWWHRAPGRLPVRNFPQLSVILGYLGAGHTASATWIADRVVRSHPRKTDSYWLASALQVWSEDWHEVVTRHAAVFPGGDVREVLKSHSRQTRLLSAKHLLVMRAAGLFDSGKLAQGGGRLSACSTVGDLGLRLVASMPQALARRLVAARPTWQRRYLPPQPVPPTPRA